ncbi:MAG: hypothetical protein QOJ72_2873 [Nocardioidaceae bacterium]|nr:hypothetical protein [Nocardioidaceae bacterium]
MKFRLTLLLVALPAVLAGLLVATPADASSHDAYLKSSTIVIHTNGLGRASISCHSSHTCKGTTAFQGATTGRYRSFSVPGNSTQYVDVAVNTADPAYPGGGVGEGHRTAAVLKVHETSPHDRQYQYDVHTESPVTSQQIQGTINAHYPAGTLTADKMQHLKVELFRELRGGNVELLHTYPVTEGGTYHFNAKLGTNNHSSNPYQLKISGVDQDGSARSWYWRGASGATTGGSRYIRKATNVSATSFGPFTADFNYGSIDGTIRNSSSAPVEDADITVAAPPPPGSTAATNRDLDLASCADVHGRTETNASGKYEVDFLPYNPSGDQRYMVGVQKGTSLVKWNDDFGSCLDTIGYGSNTRANLIDLDASGGSPTRNYQFESFRTMNIDGHYSGFSPTSQGDRWITIREYVPGLTTLEDPVYVQGKSNSSGDASFALPPGKYRLELGRRTGCSDWQKSHFPNNDAYFKGLDRGSEVWKSFSRLSALSSSKESLARHADPNPATSAEQGHIPSGYHGWMYRDYCKAYGAGSITDMTVGGFGGSDDKNTGTDKKGAVVKGHVSRTGGRTNKEILVRLSSSRQTLVLRTDITDGGGNFYIAGVATGTYTVSVNSDSWRGIGRTFTGHHTIHVTAGHGYNLGTLHFKG